MMPIKMDDSGKRWVEMELVVPGTPEQVWNAVATGPGNTAWFTEAEIEPHVGGALRFSFGDEVVSKGEVITWQPPAHFAYVERDWEEGAPPLTTEISVTERKGGHCLVRMVHALVASQDSWDDQLESFERGWPAFFAVLRVYLAHFAGQRAASFMVIGPVAGHGLSAWRRLSDMLRIDGVNVGDWRAAAIEPEPWSGVTEHVYQDETRRHVVVRLDAPSPGVALIGSEERGDTTYLSVHRFFYGDHVAARAAESRVRWHAFLPATFGPG